jgi:hypothetical protein
MKIRHAAFAVLATVSAPALAQTAAPAPAAQPQATQQPEAQAAPSTVPPPVVLKAVEPQLTNVLPSNSEIVLSLNSNLDSHDVKLGDHFQLSVARDVMMGNYIVIPRGTPAEGEVTWRTGRGVFGKSGKMEIAIRAIQMNGKSIPVAGQFKQNGTGNTGATLGAVALVGGVGGLFVHGRSATWPQGHEFKVYTKEAVPVEHATQ